MMKMPEKGATVRSKGLAAHYGKGNYMLFPVM